MASSDHARPRIVVLTTAGSRYGLRLLNALSRANVRPPAVLVRSESWRRQLRLLGAVAGRIGWPDAFAATLRALDIARRSRGSIWRGEELIQDFWQLAGEVVCVKDFDCDAGGGALARLNADYLLLAQSGIVSPRVLAHATAGVLNAHPGWLPYFRGVDAPWWTLHEGRPDLLGSTLHFVDAGVDTGEIVRVRPCAPSVRPPFVILEERLYEDCIDLLVEAVVDIDQGRRLPRHPQRREDGKQYYKMTVAAFRRAKRAYDGWTPASAQTCAMVGR